MTILEVQNIYKSYASVVALEDISLQLTAGSIHGLLGPNGAGKTTLLRIVNRIFFPDRGEVFFFGETMEDKHLSQIGYLPEERGLYKKMAVGDQAMYLCALKGVPAAEAKKKLMYWFEKFSIAGWWNRKVLELSKGMQQKLQFIITVAHNPDLLILDEPFSGFDPINANLMKEELAEWRKAGKTILLSTHDMNSVEELCDNITLIDKSKIILQGNLQKIKETHKTGIVEIHIRSQENMIRGHVPSSCKILTMHGAGDIKHIKLMLSPEYRLNNIIEALLPAGEIMACRELLPDMNDIFISAIKNNQ